MLADAGGNSCPYPAGIRHGPDDLQRASHWQELYFPLRRRGWCGQCQLWRGTTIDALASMFHPLSPRRGCFSSSRPVGSARELATGDEQLPERRPLGAWGVRKDAVGTRIRV
jgi:hypothetical protein